jgi:hypothetical protein
VSTRAKEDESSTGHVRAAGFHHVTARSRLAGILKLNELFISSISQFFWGGCGEPQITETTDAGSADTGGTPVPHRGSVHLPCVTWQMLSQ